MNDFPVASPCTNVCRMDGATGLCEGCFRTLDEIAYWSRFDNEQKRSILNAVAQRKAEQDASTRRCGCGH